MPGSEKKWKKAKSGFVMEISNEQVTISMVKEIGEGSYGTIVQKAKIQGLNQAIVLKSVKSHVQERIDKTVKAKNDDEIPAQELVQKILNKADAYREEEESKIINEARYYEIFDLFKGLKLDENSSIIAIPYLGQNVQSLLEAGKLDANDILIIIHGLLRSLVKMHAAGIVHGDVKLENLLYSCAMGRAILIDFGLSFPQDEKQLVPRGTPYTMAPEVTTNGQSIVGDIWSAGITIIWLLETYLKRINDNDAAVILISKENKLEQRSEFKGFPENYIALLEKELQITTESAKALTYIVGRMLESQPEKRFFNVKLLLEVYEKLLETSYLLPAEINMVMTQINEIKDVVDNIIADLEEIIAVRYKIFVPKKVAAVLGNKTNPDGDRPSSKTFYDLQRKIENFQQANQDFDVLDRIVVFEFRNEIIKNLKFLNRKSIDVVKKDYEKRMNSPWPDFFWHSKPERVHHTLQDVSEKIEKQYDRLRLKNNN